MLNMNDKHVKSKNQFIFPFQPNQVFDFSDKKKIKTFQQENNESSSEEKNEESLNLEETLSNFYEYSLDCYKKKCMKH